MTKTRIKYFGKTDVGMVRDHNEDTFTMIDLSNVDGNNFGIVLMVADGMGGANAGEVASDIACKVVEDRYLKLKQLPGSFRDVEKYLKNLILEAHYQIVDHASQHPECEGMGTTAVIAWVIDNYLHLVWCGDSRAYVYQEGQKSLLKPISDDHSLVWEMVKRGELSPEEARVHHQSNIILQVLGSTDTKPNPSYLHQKIDKGDKILLCSDGLNGMLSDAQIQQLLARYSDLNECTEVLVEAARNAGGTDNITVVMGEVLQREKRPALSKGSGGFLKSKWPFVLAALILLTIILVLYSAIVEKRQASASVASNEISGNDQGQSPAMSFPDEAGSVQELKAPGTQTSNRKVADQNIRLEDATPDSLHTAFPFAEELHKLQEQFEDKARSLEAVNQECDSCATRYDADLVRLNNIISSTREHLQLQVKGAEADGQVTKATREKLVSLSKPMGIAYDPRKSFQEDPYGEQKYIISTLELLLLKVNAEIDKFTTTPRKIE